MSIIQRIYGRDGEHSTCYLTRVKLTPKTRWGQLYFHFFHRGDQDRDFHDHPYDFWTFPLRTYYEQVLDIDGILGQARVMGHPRLNEVKAFRLHHRYAEYSHIQLGAARYRWTTETQGEPPFHWVRENIFGGWTATFVLRHSTRRQWGFWERVGETESGIRLYHHTGWRYYLFS